MWYGLQVQYNLHHNVPKDLICHQWSHWYLHQSYVICNILQWIEVFKKKTIVGIIYSSNFHTPFKIPNGRSAYIRMLGYLKLYTQNIGDKHCFLFDISIFGLPHVGSCMVWTLFENIMKFMVPWVHIRLRWDLWLYNIQSCFVLFFFVFFSFSSHM